MPFKNYVLLLMNELGNVKWQVQLVFDVLSTSFVTSHVGSHIFLVSLLYQHWSSCFSFISIPSYHMEYIS